MSLKMPETEYNFIQLCSSYDIQPLYAVVTGSHSWGLERPDSDIDIRGIYGWPIRRAISLFPGRDNVELTSGKLDVQAYELAKLLRMLCAANGNVVEMLHNPLVLYAHEKWGERLVSLGHQCLTRRLVNYYRGYATSQRKRAMQNRGGKALVYTYREVYSGICLMATGEIIFDFEELCKWMEQQFHSQLLVWALENRHIPITTDQLELFKDEWQELTTLLDIEMSGSLLPEREPKSFRGDCDTLLCEYRLSTAR